MADKTGIAWTDATWNCVRGCSRVSAGCINCYAERQAIRHAGPGRPYEGLARMVNGHPAWTGQIRLVPELLDQPLRWRKPRRIFVNSMSDLFHEGVPNVFIDQVFAVMALSPQHTFQILTKRPERMRDYFEARRDGDPWAEAADAIADLHGIADHPLVPEPGDMPLPNVHLGVSVEDQATADERIPLLLDTPATVRFVSYEPALAAVDFARACEITDDGWHRPVWPIDWLIVGGESGPGARPCDVEWIRSAVRQCREAGVACFVKQLGARPDGWCRGRALDPSQEYAPGFCDVYEASEGAHCGSRCAYFRDRKGADPAEWPSDLRIQQFPNGDPA